jgi:2-keto-4-pentenoate hydratase/2-oxohepta-3-ene-1,7-dioic acid hydratase in catechol pathway
MRLATFTTRAEPGRLRVGALKGEGMLELPYGSMRQLLGEGRAGLDRVRELLVTTLPAALVDLGDVIWKPSIGDAEKFLCVGKNYRTHLAELQRTGLIKELPDEPTGFIKLNACLAGHEEDVVRPASVKQLDYEPELVFVIGKAAYQVKAEHAFEHVVGITLLNDLTCRETQKREVVSGSRFWTAKNAPGFGPLGPCIVTLDEVADPYDLWVSCSVNGEERMRVNTSEQIWKLPAIIEHFSRLIPLHPGDMFSTGAPGGVAVGKANAEALFLKPGDVVECAIESPALVLRNRIVAPLN